MIMEKTEIYIRVYKSLMTSGILADMGDRLFSTLIVLAFHMDEKGECYPTQEQLAKWLGVTRQRANARVQDLLKYRFNGKPVLLLLETNQNRRNNVYKIEPISQMAIFKGEVESLNVSRKQDISSDKDADVSRKRDNDMSRKQDTNMSQKQDTNNNQLTKTNITINNNCPTELEPQSETLTVDIKTPKEVITYFCSQYRKTYSVNYSPNWKRDVGMVKKKLLDVYTPEQIKGIIDVVFEEYDRRWAREKYPRPSLGSLTTWLPNEVLAILDVKRKEKERLQAAMKAPEPDMDKIIAFLEQRCGNA